MASRGLLTQVTLICMIYAMLALVGMSQETPPEHSPSQAPAPYHSPAPAPPPPSLSSPRPSSNSSTGSGNGSAADCTPHMFATTLVASLGFLLPFLHSIFY